MDAWAQAPPPVLEFTAGEMRRIAAHGPWPPPQPADPGNALSGNPAAIALGQLLFLDRRMSPDARLACASCHQSARAFGDGLSRSLGREPMGRNAPSLWNAGHQRWYGWDGASDSLWSQALLPLLDPREMAASAAHVRSLIHGDKELACRYAHSGGELASADSEAVLVHSAKALAAFVATLTSARTPFDDFRDAMLRGDRRAAARYPLAAQRGLRLFVGRAQCSSCHSGAGFSNGEFADIGVPYFSGPGIVDPGRHGGITALRSGSYNLLSRWSDATGAEVSTKTRHVEAHHRNFGEFKVPSLRNVEHTAPYMHAGSLASLQDVVNHYSEIDLERLHADGEQLLKPLRLNAGERADMLAFLRSLTDPGAQRWRPKALPPCPVPGR